MSKFVFTAKVVSEYKNSITISKKVLKYTTTTITDRFISNLNFKLQFLFFT